jgi:hypothetical protein
VRATDYLLPRDGMNRGAFATHPLPSGVLLLSAGLLLAANARDFTEAVRRRAPVVYVGVVREVTLLERTKFDIKARATVKVLNVARAPAGTSAEEASVSYSTYLEFAYS